jgi:hypothetical protein
MPATATGRGAQVVLDPIGDPAKAARGAYAATLELNLLKQRTDVAAGTIADGSTSDGRTNTGGVAVDDVFSPSAAPLAVSSITLGTVTIRAGTGAATGTQPSGCIWIRTDGSAGARIYVSQGAGTWVPIAAV